MGARSESLLRLSLRETFSNFLFTLLSLLLLLLTHHPVLTHLTQTYTRLSIHLTLLIPLLLAYDILNLSFSSTLNPSLALLTHLTNPNPPPLPTLLTTILSQIFGQTLSIFLLRSYKHNQQYLLPLSPAEDVGKGTGILVEALLTFLLGMTVLVSGKVKRYEVRLGGVVAVVVMLIGWGSEWTGPGMNPGLAFALGCGNGVWRDLEVYWLGPVVGAVAAAGLWRWWGGVEKDGRSKVVKKLKKM